MLDIRKRTTYAMTIIKNWNRVLREKHSKDPWRAQGISVEGFLILFFKSRLCKVLSRVV